MDLENEHAGAPQWENLNNTEGLPVVELKEVGGLYRAFFHMPGGKREWVLVAKTDTGWVERTPRRYAYVGPVKWEGNELRADVQEIGQVRHQPLFLVPEETTA